MATKAPRRTAQRILDSSLALFNRYGEPNVSTTLISAELNISPGNLYYHFPAKEELVNALFERYQNALIPLLAAATDIKNIEDAWFFIHSLFEIVWQYRFLYRDLNDLLSRNRMLESQTKDILLHKTSAFKSLLQGLEVSGSTQMGVRERKSCAVQMVVMLTWWLSYEYVRDPRKALEDENAQMSVLKGAVQMLRILLPYLIDKDRKHLQVLLEAYDTEHEE
jgi:AcrR family transcriptional regulator